MRPPVRVGFWKSLTAREIDKIASNRAVTTVQCSVPWLVRPQTWELLNHNLFPRRPDIELRVFAHSPATDVCNLSFVEKLYNVRRFSADNLNKAIGVEHLAALENLKELGIGIDNQESFDFLKTLPTGIKSLALYETKSRKPRLDGLERLRSLRRLYLARQQNGIEVLAALRKLESITLRSISTPNLEYISGLPRLRSLRILLGGIRSLSAISGKKSLQYLVLVRIRGLSDISVLSSLTGLQSAVLEDLRNIRRVPDLSRLTKLWELRLVNLKGLRDVRGVLRAPALETFVHTSARNTRPEHYKGLLNKLSGFTVTFRDRDKDREFKAMVERAGQTSLFNFQRWP